MLREDCYFLRMPLKLVVNAADPPVGEYLVNYCAFENFSVIRFLVVFTVRYADQYGHEIYLDPPIFGVAHKKFGVLI